MADLMRIISRDAFAAVLAEAQARTQALDPSRWPLLQQIAEQLEFMARTTTRGRVDVVGSAALTAWALLGNGWKTGVVEPASTRDAASGKPRGHASSAPGSGAPGGDGALRW